MAVWSKVLDVSCYELGHTWNPSCTGATFDVAIAAFREAFKVYAPLYMITALLRRRGKDYYKKRLLPEILQSTLFLGTNAFLFIAAFCVWRKLAGCYCYFNVFACGVPACALALSLERADRKIHGPFSFLTTSIIPAWFACFAAICVERKSRRGMLALYLLNLATETAFRMLVSRGIVKPIKNGEVLLFSCATSVYMYLFRKRNGLNSSMSSGLRFLVGSSELPPGDENRNEGTASSGGSNANSNSPSSTRSSPVRSKKRGVLSYLPRDIQHLMMMVSQGPRHKLCQHQDSCLASTAQRFVKMFGVGYAIQAALKLLGALKSITRRPKAVLQALIHPENKNLGLFLATFSGVFKAVSCALRWLREKDSSIHGLPAGFLAGISMMWFKSSSLAMYVTAKLAEILYFKGIESGILPYIKMGDILVYSLSTAFVFHAAVLEPHNLRPAYWRFLLQLTENRFKLMNRRILDIFGTKASTLYPDYWPDYDPKFTNLKPPPPVA